MRDNDSVSVSDFTQKQGLGLGHLWLSEANLLVGGNRRARGKVLSAEVIWFSRRAARGATLPIGLRLSAPHDSRHHPPPNTHRAGELNSRRAHSRE